MRLRTANIIIPVAIVLVAILGFLLMLLTKSTPKSAKVEEKIWTVAVKKIKLATYTPNLVLHGTVESPRHATLKAAVTADVISTPVEEGEDIREGQLFVHLDPSDATLALQQRTGEVEAQKAKIAAENARFEADKKSLIHEKKLVELNRRALKRQLDLREHTSKAAVDQAREELNQAQLNLRQRELAVQDHKNRLAEIEAQLKQQQALQGQAALDLRRTEILAPFTGRVAKLTVAVGDRVRPGDEIGQIFDIAALEVRAQIPGQYLETIRKALIDQQSLTAKTDVDGQLVTLVLDRLASTVGKGRSGVDGLFKVKTGERYLEIGRTVELLLNLPAEKNVVALPAQALYGLDLVYKIVNQRLVSVKVKRVGSITSLMGKRQALIRSLGLQADDKVVTTQLPNAITGLKVRVVKDK